ncbi:type II secretion system F family protein [bacterium]|nr:type II secretion system F family protein [bacterium]
MPVFNYTAITPSGRTISGKADVASMDALGAQLAKERLELVEAKAGGLAGLSGMGESEVVKDLTGREKVSRRELVDFFFQLSVLLKAGVPLLKALDLIANDASSSKFKSILRNLAAQVQSGSTFAEATAAFPNAFPPVALALLKVAEKSGTLPDICAELRRYIDWLDKLYADIKQALVYPSILIGATIAFMFVIFTFVMPKFIKILDEIKVPLPWLTKQVIAFTHLFQYHWYQLLIGLGVLVVVYKCLMIYYPPFALWIDRKKLQMPVFGPLNLMLCMSRFGQNLATMYRSGILMLESLKLCRELVGNRALAEAVDRIHDGVATGRKIHEMMKESDLFPNLVLQMVTTGENTGKLAESLQNVVDYYNDIIPRAIKKLFGIIEPAIIVSLIVTIGIIALSVFLPMTSMLNMTKA